MDSMDSNMQQPTDQDSGVTGFSDDADTRLFETCGDAQLVAKLLRIKHNAPTVDRLLVRYNVNLDDELSRRFGDIVGQSTHLEELRLRGCPRVNVEAMSAGLQSNRSIRKFSLAYIDFHNSQSMSSVAPFLTHNHSLKDISFVDCRLGPASINILANALKNGTGNSLEKINLHNNPIGDIAMDDLVQSLSDGRCLRYLDFSRCGIGPRACTSLATLLENRESNLTFLDLGGNTIDNQSTITLASSLVNNKKLQHLHLRGNNMITAEGWSVMLRLVFNSSSIKHVMNSNHVLCSLWPMHMNVITEMIQILGEDDCNLLRALLQLNEGRNELLVARRKIIWGHAQGCFNIGESSIATGAMPRILAWIGNDSNETDARFVQYQEPPLREPEIGTIRLGGIYRILRSVPDLCNLERDVHEQM